MSKFDPEECHKTLIQMREKDETELLESVDTTKLFIAVIANTSFGPEGSISEITHRDVPAQIETS